MSFMLRKYNSIANWRRYASLSGLSAEVLEAVSATPPSPDHLINDQGMVLSFAWDIWSADFFSRTKYGARGFASS